MNNYLIEQNLSIKDAAQKLNDLSSGVINLFVIDETGRLLGSLTDGDIRRGLLNGLTLDSHVKQVMNPNCEFIPINNYDLSHLDRIREKKISLVPITNKDKMIVSLLDLTRKESFLPIQAIIMAGGEGVRLRPFTESVPKPLLKIGEKSIIDYNIDRLAKFGVENLHIAIRYLGEQIVAHLGDGNGRGIRISYIKETTPLGTIGALGLIDNFLFDYVLVMNADLLTNIDFEDMYRSCVAVDADMAVASVAYRVNVPYAIFEMNGNSITSLQEKPTYTYQSNAGIYLIKKKWLEQIPKGEYFNATDLLEKMLAEKANVIPYSIVGYWLDIGKHEDFSRAQNDVKHIKF